MMGGRVVAQKPLLYEFSLDRHVPTERLHSARISFDRCGRVSFRLNYAHLMVLRYLAHRKEKLADIEILESDAGAVENGDIVPRDPARTAPFEQRADCVQDQFAAFDPFANMLKFP